MKLFASQIETLIQQDPGKRGLNTWAVQDQILPAGLSLLSGNHILLATGFYILSADAIETDGPPGALILAHALEQMGKRVTLLFDSHSVQIMEAGQRALGSSIEMISLEPGRVPEAKDLIKEETTHFIALERPGQAVDGSFYNFSGRCIDAYHACLDHIFAGCMDRGIKTIGIGDGGNELGMGTVSTAVDSHHSLNRPFSCQTAADFCICAGVSNWAGYALCALFSGIRGEDLMPDPAVLTDILEAIVEAGAVDGISGEARNTVDGLHEDWEMTVYRTLFNLSSKRERELISQ